MINPNIEIVNVVKSCEMSSQMIWNEVVIEIHDETEIYNKLL